MIIDDLTTVKKTDLPKEKDFVPQDVGRVQTKEEMLHGAFLTLFLSCMALSLPLLVNMISATMGDGGATPVAVNPQSVASLGEIGASLAQELNTTIKLIAGAGFLMGLSLFGVSFLKFKTWTKHRNTSKPCKNSFYFEKLYQNLGRYSEDLLRVMAYCEEYSTQTQEDILDYLVCNKGMDKSNLVKPKTLFEAITTKNEEAGVALKDTLKDKEATPVLQKQYHQSM